MANIVICWNCSSKTEVGFCSNCGAEIIDPNAPKEEETTSTTVSYQNSKHYFESSNHDYYGVMYGLIGANVLFYIVTSIMGGSILELGIYPLILFGSSYYSLQQGRYYVLVTSMFTHANLLHIVINLFAIGFLIPRMSQLGYGTRGLLVTYFVTGIVGGYLTAIITPLAFSVGASGALFGWDGVYIATLRRQNSSLWMNYMLYSVLYIVLAPFIIPQITFWGHVIPFILGLIMGSLSVIDKLRIIPDST